MNEFERLNQLASRAKQQEHADIDVSRGVFDRLQAVDARQSRTRRRTGLAFASVAAALIAAWMFSSRPSGELGNTPPQDTLSFRLPDAHGTFHASEEFQDHDVLVVAFLGVDCPLSRLYAPRLQQLHATYLEQGVAFVAIDANPQDSLNEMRGFAQQMELTIPFLKDRDQSSADRFGATRNPEVFVLDRRRQIVYRGRIDDQYGLGPSSGHARPAPTENNLSRALEEVLAGLTVSQPETLAVGCLIGRSPRVEPSGEVTYSRQIARLVEDKCASCHRPGQIGPFALTEYEEVAGWGAMIKEVVSEGRMPPWSADPQFGVFANDCRLSETERNLFAQWVDHGCPQGDPAEQPTPKHWVDGWAIGQPDQIVAMPEAIRVPAQGVMGYRNFVLDPGWTEDKWVVAAECVPGHRDVVHHMIVSVVDSEGRRVRAPGDEGTRDLAARFGFRGGMLASYVPGLTATTLDDGLAQFVPAGSKLNLQIHYTPNGKAVDDISSVGLRFGDPTKIRKLVHGGAAVNAAFTIPPHKAGHPVVASATTRDDQLLLWVSPHMHNRGQAMRYEARYPDGTSEILLDVPRYDFNWQIRYILAEPKLLPAGTTIACTALFDNSESNIANPNPDVTVRFGPQPFDEMMVGFYATISVQDDAHER